MKFAMLVGTSNEVAGTSRRLLKTEKLASLVEQLAPDEVSIAVGFLIGWPRQGKIGVGWATVASARETAPAVESTLELHDVDVVFSELRMATGKGSTARRLELLRGLFARATSEEQEFLTALVIGEVRQGALEVGDVEPRGLDHGTQSGIDREHRGVDAVQADIAEKVDPHRGALATPRARLQEPRSAYSGRRIGMSNPAPAEGGRGKGSTKPGPMARRGGDDQIPVS